MLALLAGAAIAPSPALATTSDIGGSQFTVTITGAGGITGTSGPEVILGDDGGDLFIGGAGNNLCDGGAGLDILISDCGTLVGFP